MDQQGPGAFRGSRQWFVRSAAAAMSTIPIVAPERSFAKASPNYTITVGTPGGPPVTAEVAIDNWARAVNAKTRGEVSVHVVHNGQLGNDQQLVRSAQSNAIQMVATSNANFDSFTPAMQVFELPFFFRDAAAYFRGWDGAAGQKIRSTVEKTLGLKLLMVLDAGGFRSVLTRRKPVRLPSDLSGLKLRIAPTPVELATFKQFGVDVITAANSEIFTLLQQGTIDGVVLQAIWINADKLQEIAKYFCDIRYVMYAYLVFVGLDFFKSLPRDMQDVLVATAEEEQGRERQAVSASISDAMTAITKAGVDMHELNSKERAAWVSSTRSIWAQFEPKIGRDLMTAMQNQ